MAKEVFESAMVIGAAGHTGEMIVRSLAPITRVDAIVKKTRRFFPPNVRVFSRIDTAFLREPEAVIVATPNPLDIVLKEIAEASKRPPVLVLTSNGVIVPRALEILGDRPDIPIVRGCIFTTVGRNEQGGLVHGPKRIALSQVRGADAAEKAQDLFEAGRFETVIVPDPKSLEWTKLLANLVGSTGAVTGLGPKETFSDKELYELEQKAIRDRLAILEASGIPFADIPWVKQMLLIPKVPSVGRGFVADKVAKSRNNRPPAAAKQIKGGERRVEASGHYHKKIIDLGRKFGLRSTLDEAIFESLMRHERGGMDLKEMNEEARRALLLDVYRHEAYQVHRESSPLITAVAEGLTRIATRKYEALGGYHIFEVLDSLRRGRSVVFAANHLSHADHPELVRGIKERMGPEFDEYNLLIVAGMLYRNDLIMRVLDKTYPHLTVSTLTEEAADEEKWKSQMVNRRSGKVAEDCLKDPTMLVVYYEGSRSRNGKLQKAKPGASGYSLHPNIELVVPVAIQGTDSIWRPGNKFFRLGEASVEFGKPIKRDEIKALAEDLPRNLRDEFMSGYVMRRIAQMLPEEQRGFYS